MQEDMALSSLLTWIHDQLPSMYDQSSHGVSDFCLNAALFIRTVGLRCHSAVDTSTYSESLAYRWTEGGIEKSEGSLIVDGQR
jgi:hypothetical protein